MMTVINILQVNKQLKKIEEDQQIIKTEMDKQVSEIDMDLVCHSQIEILDIVHNILPVLLKITNMGGN